MAFRCVPNAALRNLQQCDFVTVANPVDIYMILMLLVTNLADMLATPPPSSYSSVKTCLTTKPDPLETWLDDMSLLRIAY